MITIWVHKKDLNKFVKAIKDIYLSESIDFKFYTSLPWSSIHNCPDINYIQLTIDYNEYVQLKDKNNKK